MSILAIKGNWFQNVPMAIGVTDVNFPVLSTASTAHVTETMAHAWHVLLDIMVQHARKCVDIVRLRNVDSMMENVLMVAIMAFLG